MKSLLAIVVLPPDTHSSTNNKVAHLETFVFNDDFPELSTMTAEATSSTLTAKFQ